MNARRPVRIALAIALAAVVAAVVWFWLKPARSVRTVTLPSADAHTGSKPAPPPELPPPSAAPTLAASPIPGATPAAAEARPDEVEPGGIVMPNPRSLPIDVVVVDAASGRPVPESRPEAPSHGIAHLDPNGNTWISRRCTVDVPQGYAAWDEPKIHTVVGRRATSLRHVYPLRPEALAFLSIRHQNGELASDVRLGASVGGRAVDVRWDPSDGRVSGLPFLRGERVVFSVGDGEQSRWEGRFGDEALAPLRAELLFQPHGRIFRGVGGSARATIGGGAPRREPCAEGRIEVTVIGRDGRPLENTPVGLTGRDSARTDASGVAVFEDVETGFYYDVWTLEAGVGAARASVTVTNGETTRVTLREPEGGTVDVTVVDEAGLGLPFATLEVGKPAGLPHCDVSDDGVQRTDPYTDAFGRRTLTHVDPGRLTVSATFGERKGSVDVDVRDRDRTPARVVVR